MTVDLGRRRRDNEPGLVKISRDERTLRQSHAARNGLRHAGGMRYNIPQRHNIPWRTASGRAIAGLNGLHDPGDFIGDLRRDDADARAGGEQRPQLGGGNRTAADEQDGPSGQVEKQR